MDKTSISMLLLEVTPAVPETTTNTVYLFSPKVLKLILSLPDNDKDSAPFTIYLYATALSAEVVKLTTPLPSPLGFASSAPTISELICMFEGAIISPKE